MVSVKANNALLFIIIAICSFFTLDVQGELLFSASFDNGFDADYAKGNPAAVHHDSLELTKGKQGKGLWCKPNTYIRFETDRNVDLEEGTVCFWVKPNYTPRSFRPEFGGSVQCLFSMRIRTKDMIELRLRNDKSKPVLWLMTGAKGEEKRTNINCELDGWDDKTWHKIVLSWKRPSMLAVQIDDKPAVVVNDAVLPMLPSAMMYDMYFGTNSNQTSLFRMEHFDGVIDDVVVSDKWMDVPESYKQEKTVSVKPVKFDLIHISKNRYYKTITVEPTNDKWSVVPVKAEIDLGAKWKKLSPAAKRKAVKSFRLVRYDITTKRPVVYDAKIEGENKYFRPFVVDEDVYFKDKATLRFQHVGSEVAVYRFYYDTSAKYESPFPVEIPMVGNGERLRVGRKDTIGTLCSGISGVFDTTDVDGDGDYDLIMNSGTLKTRSCTQLQTGYYFFENISGELGVKDVFAPGKLVIRDNTPHGYISGVCVPDICDVNNDCKPDILILGRTSREWLEWHYDGNNVVIDKINEIQFSGKPLKSELKTTWYDWDNDGLGDIIASGLGNLGKDEVVPSIYVYKNIGSSDEPLIDTENPIELNIGKPDLQWQYIPVDWDEDGDLDFISCGFIHELHFHENIRKNGSHEYAQPRRLETHDRREINITQALINLVICDWDKDGDKDLLYGCEDGVVGFIENIAGSKTAPKLLQPVYLQQTYPLVDGGTISVPVVTDWNGDGNKDMILAASNTMQYYENLGTDSKPVWNWPTDMKAGDMIISLRAGEDGSIQGIEELCWQYNNAEVADWDADGLKDLIVSGIRGEHVFFKNIGTKTEPRLQRGQLIKVNWDGKHLYPSWNSFTPQPDSLVTVWRTRPVVIDWNGDGLMDYVTLDHKGELALYLRYKTSDGNLELKPPQNIFTLETPYSQALVWNRPPNAQKGRAGRTVINLIDWDKDGDYDLVLDNVNARYYENTANNDKPVFVDRGDLVKERLTNHNDGPYVIDWDNDGWYDLFIGTETGRVYYFSRPYIENEGPSVNVLD